MSKRLQVPLPDREMSDIQRLAKREHLTVGEWVRRALREARTRRPAIEPETKLKAVRDGAKYSFPTAVHAVADTQDTAASEFWLPGLGLGTIDQDAPFHDSTSVAP